MGSWGKKAYWAAAVALPLLYACLGVWQKASTGIQLELLLLVALAAPAHLARLLAWRELLPRPHPAWIGFEAVALLGVGSRVVAEWSLLLVVLVACAHAMTVGRPDRPAPRWLHLSGRVAVALAVLACCGFAWKGKGGGWARVVLASPILAEALLPLALASSGAAVRRWSAALVIGALPLAREGVLLELPAVPLLPLIPVAAVALRYRTTPAPQRRKATRRWVVRVVFPLVLLGLGWAVGELAFRVVPNRYAELNWGSGGGFHIPGEHFVYRGAHLGAKQPANELVWNQHGWHDVDHELEKPDARLRVLVVGDSYVEGIQVPLEDLYHRQLEAGLAAVSTRTVEAIAYGWSGWGQRQELEALTAGIELEHPTRSIPAGLDYQPDLVVLEFLPANDVRNNSDDLERLAGLEASKSTFVRPYFSLAVRYRLWFTAFFCDKLDGFLRRVSGSTQSLDTSVWEPTPSAHGELWEQAWATTEALVGQLQAAVQARGAQLVVVVFTSQMEVMAAAGGPTVAELDMALGAERMEALCTALGVPVLRLAPRLAKLPGAGEGKVHIPGDGHWTVLGHKTAAEETVRFLTEETEIWRSVQERR